jgi:hypothetical protein
MREDGRRDRGLADTHGADRGCAGRITAALGRDPDSRGQGAAHQERGTDASPQDPKLSPPASPCRPRACRARRARRGWCPARSPSRRARGAIAARAAPWLRSPRRRRRSISSRSTTATCWVMIPARAAARCQLHPLRTETGAGGLRDPQQQGRPRRGPPVAAYLAGDGLLTHPAARPVEADIVAFPRHDRQRRAARCAPRTAR